MCCKITGTSILVALNTRIMIPHNCDMQKCWKESPFFHASIFCDSIPAELLYLSVVSFIMWSIQGSEIRFAKHAKQDQGRARQNSQARGGTNFTKPPTSLISELCIFQTLDMIQLMKQFRVSLLPNQPKGSGGPIGFCCLYCKLQWVRSWKQKQDLWLTFKLSHRGWTPWTNTMLNTYQVEYVLL